MRFQIIRMKFDNKLYVQIGYKFDRWQEDDFIYEASLDAIIQCLDEEDLVKLTGTEPVKVLREYIDDYFDYIYDWFYEDAFDEWSRTDAPSL